MSGKPHYRRVSRVRGNGLSCARDPLARAHIGVRVGCNGAVLACVLSWVVGRVILCLGDCDVPQGTAEGVGVASER